MLTPESHREPHLDPVSEAERQERLAFLQITDADLEVLAELHPLFLERREAFLDLFYEHLQKFPDTKAILRDAATMQRARRGQSEFMERMLVGPFDQEFFERSMRAGRRHQEIGLEPKWMVSSWSLYLTFWSREILERLGADSEKAARCLQALHKVILLGTGLGVDAYYGKTLERIQDVVSLQRKAILELSTPVIQIWEGILVLPLIGTIDSARTRQIMEDLLTRVVETQSEVAILDLTGVSVVDTAVANHLMKTVEAAELLGTRCILTGISPAIAQTLVHLGVDLGHIVTCSTLKTGLQRALRMRGMGVRTLEE